tara:strand:- start:352 stop:993 length:642 start_codon:yes stop_codon:yes gene_type:complete
MAGAGLGGLKEDGLIPSDIRRKALISSLFFSLGIITVFILLGAAAFSVSQAFRSFQDEFRWFAAVVIFIMSFHFLGILKIGFLDRQFQVNTGDTNKMDAVGSYLVGLAFAAGWTPCVGGVLTAVIMTASVEATALRGIFLLFVFGVGLTLPFVLAAFFIKPFLNFAANFRPYLGYVEKLMGLILILFSMLLVTGSISRLANWMLLVFPQFFGV